MEKDLKTIIQEEIMNSHVEEGVGDKYLERTRHMPDEFSGFERKFNAAQAEDEIVYQEGDWILYKNPKNLNNVDKSARGVIDSDGNLFIENYGLKIHHDIIKILLSKGYLKGYAFKRNWNKYLPSQVGFLTVQRYMDGPIAIGHSNKLIYDEEGFNEHYSEFNSFMERARQKNPGIKFETKLVSSKFRVLKQQSALSESNKLSQYEDQCNHYM